MQSYGSWHAISKEKAENLSNAGFFNTGKALHREKPVYYKIKTFSQNCLL